MTEALVALLVLLPVIVWWQMATRAREQAAEYVHRACQDADVQWLDSTVIFHRWEWVKDSRAKRYLRRTYLFEYCDDGISRNGSASGPHWWEITREFTLHLRRSAHAHDLF